MEEIFGEIIKFQKERGLEKNKNSIDALSQDSKENIDKFLSQKRIIEFTIRYENELHKNAETLKTYGKSELFTLAGREFYRAAINITQ